MANFGVEAFTKEFVAGAYPPTLLLFSFLGGILASMSPCVLGILPIIIGYIGGYSKEGGIKTFIQLLSFVVGLSLVLSIIGVLCAISGKVLAAFAGPYWVLFLASLIMLFGLNLVGVLDINFPAIVKEMPKNKGGHLILYPIIVGGAFALASTPCSTPILAAIMGIASLSKNILLSMAMLFLFSLGQGLVIIIAGVSVSALKQAKHFHRISEILMKLSGVLLVAAAMYIYIRIFSQFF